MNIEYIELGESRSLVKIFGNSTAEFSQLQKATKSLADGLVDWIAIEELNGFQAIQNCSLVLIATVQNGEITKSVEDQQNRVEFRLSPKTWSVVTDLIEPFTKSPLLYRHHQWLCGNEARGDLGAAKIGVVLSTHKDGSW